MDICTTIKNEHETIKSMLAILDSLCTRLETGETVEPDHLHRVVDFLSDFADREHHLKEENIIFPCLKRMKVAAHDELVDDLMSDHEFGRMFVRSMREAAEEIESGSNSGADDFATSARAYVMLLMHHICKENNVLVPIIEREMKSSHRKAMNDELRQIAANGGGANHQESTSLIDTLKSKYGSNEEILKVCV